MTDRISVAGVLKKGERYLVMHRLPGGSVGGKWEFPGGKVDPGETPGQALMREWKEETDFNIDLGSEITRGSFVHKGEPVTLIAFEVSVSEDAGDPALNEHDDWRWCTPGEIAELDLVESDSVVLKAISS